MPLNYFKNKKTGKIKQSLKATLGAGWEKLISAPHSKIMECVDEFTGKSSLKNSEKMFRERSKNFSRNHDIDDTIQFYKKNGLNSTVEQKLLNSKGERRRKVDDI